MIESFDSTISQFTLQVVYAFKGCHPANLGHLIKTVVSLNPSACTHTCFLQLTRLPVNIYPYCLLLYCASVSFIY
jgi:hypothetical protein